MNKVIWLTGLSGSGKTTLANLLKEKLTCKVIDGDALRRSTANTDYTINGRLKNVQNALKLCHESPKSTIVVALISPTKKIRDYYHRELGERLIEVYLQCSLKTCIRRDVKGLYSKALYGGIENFTGINHLYEEPINPDLVVNTEFYTPKDSVRDIIIKLRGEGANHVI